MSKLIVYRDSQGKEVTTYKESTEMSRALDIIKDIRREKDIQRFDINHFVMESWGDVFIYVCSHLDFETKKYMVIPFTFFGDTKNPTSILDTMKRECNIRFWPDGLGPSFETEIADPIPLDQLVSQVFDACHFYSFPGSKLRFKGVKGGRSSFMNSRSRIKAKFYTHYLKPVFTQTFSFSSIKFSTLNFDLESFLMKARMCARVMESLNSYPLGRYIKSIEQSLTDHQKQWNSVRLSFLKNWEKVVNNSSHYDLSRLNNVQDTNDHKLFTQVLNKASSNIDISSIDISPCLSLTRVPVIMDKADRERIIRLRQAQNRRRSGASKKSRFFNEVQYPDPYERHSMFTFMNYLVIPPACFTYLSNLLHISGMHDITINNMLKFLLRSA